VKRKLLVLADLLRADLAEFSGAVEEDDLDAASEKLQQFAVRCADAAQELRAA
jgi:hypothetical protein